MYTSQATLLILQGSAQVAESFWSLGWCPPLQFGEMLGGCMDAEDAADLYGGHKWDTNGDV